MYQSDAYTYVFYSYKTDLESLYFILSQSSVLILSIIINNNNNNKNANKTQKYGIQTGKL